MITHIKSRTRSARFSFLLLSGVVLSGCVSSTIDTPQGFVSTLEQPTASDVLSISETDSGATAKVEPTAAPKIEVASAAPAPQPPINPALPEVAPTTKEVAATPVAVSAPTNADVANARIDGAANAPLANGQTAPQVASVAQAPITATAPPARTGLLSALFSNSDRTPPAAVGAPKAARVIATATPEPKAPAPAVIAIASASGSASALPGVDRNRAMGVTTTTDLEDGTEEIAPVQVASAAGLARLAPGGLTTQHDGVDVKCFKPALVRVLKTVERKYGKPVVVTSGYRSPSRNKRASGAKNSLHIYCAAADIQVSGVSKWELAKYLRSMPGRGGVGTYCHTNSVHVDIGPNRDWNWRCRRKK